MAAQVLVHVDAYVICVDQLAKALRTASEQITKHAPKQSAKAAERA